MMNFKNSKTAKAISGIVGLATAVMMMGPAVASAATVEELTAQINALLAQVSALQAAQTTTTTTTQSQTSCTASFGTNLKQGMTNAEVLALQKFLNMSVDTQVSVSGAGSPGMETSYFGPATKAAVIKFQNKYATDILNPVGLTQGTGFVGASTRAKINAMCTSGSTTTTTTTLPEGCTSSIGFSTKTGLSCSTGMTALPTGCTSVVGFSPTTGVSCSSGTVVVTGAGVQVALDASSPAGSTLISPQGVATLAVFRLANATAAPVKVTMFKFQRTGISSDSTLNNVYLYQGSARLSDSASIATGMISFTDTAGIVTIPAGGSVAVAVRADVASGMSGQTVGIMLTEVTTDAGAVTGLPVSGSQHTMASAPAGMTTADFTGSFSPASGAIDPQNDYVIWQKSINIGSRDANLSSIRFQQLGSVGAEDVKNFRLMIDGVTVGTPVEKVDANRYVTFALPTPVAVKAGTHVVKVMIDVVGGSTRTVQLSLRRAIDVELTDSQLGVSVTPTVGSAAFSAIQQTTAISINAGALTITKATDSTSGNVVLQGSAVTLAKYTLHAAGEDMKVENLTIGWAGTSSTAKLRNGALFANGVQIGSTQDILTTAAGGTAYNLGSSLVVKPGVDVTLEVRADIYNSGTLGQFVANNTITVSTLVGSSNVYGKSSLQYTNSAVVVANQVTVAAGSITLAKYGAYANQTVVVPQAAYKIGEFRLTTGSTEGVNLDTVTLALGGSVTVTDLSNLYIVYGSKTTTSKATGAASQSWSISEAVAANTTLTVAVYSTLSSVASGTTTATLTISGTSQSSGNAVTSGAVGGQIITVGLGSISSAVDATTPVSTLVVANSMPKVASFKFTTSNDAFTITELTAKASTTADAAAIKNLIFKDGGTTIATQPLNGIYATSSGLNVLVGINASKVIDVYADLGSIGTGFASTSADVRITLDGFEYKNSNGVKTPDYTDRAGNAIYAYKTKPTITNAALPSPVLNTGTQTVAKFTITADAGGTIAWRKIVMTVASSTPSGSFQVNGYGIYDESNALVANVTTNGSLTPGAGTTVTFVSTSDQEVSGSKTYTVKANVAGTPVVGSNLNHSIAQMTSPGFVASAPYATVAATAATFVWSDESSSPHSDLTQDWNNDYLVKNIPTDSQSLTK